jgi:hypothetical protein
MRKEIYILNGKPSEDYSSFQKRIINLSVCVLDQYDPETLKVSLTVKPPPGISVIPFKRKKIAVLSVNRITLEKMDLVINSEGFRGGYVVEEVIPVAYQKTWADGVPTPGECLLTLFHRKPGLDQDTFLKRWHDGHTPLSLKLHPLWNYNRNVVSGSLTNDSFWYDGIVEEQFQRASDLLNPLIFFGPPRMVPLHMYQVLTDTLSCIDMKRIETYLATEIHLKSGNSI